MIDCLLDPNLKNIQVRQDFIIATLLLLISDPKTRLYFRSQADLTRILHIFTQIDGVDKELKKDMLEKVLVQQQLASKAFVNIMRNWAGVIYMTSSTLGLRSLIDSLNQPVRIYNKIAILDMFMEIFNVPVHFAPNSSQATSSIYSEFSHIIHSNNNTERN